MVSTSMPSARRETFFLLLGDAAFLVLSLWAALTLRNLNVPTWPYFLEHLRVFVFVYAISFLIFFISGLYERQTRLVKRILGIRILGAQVANTAIAAVVFFALPLSIAPKTVLALYLVISVILISAWRFFVVPYLSLNPRQDAVLVAEGEVADQLYGEVRDNPRYYVRFAKHIVPSVSSDGQLARELEEAVRSGVELIVLDSRDPNVRAQLPTLYTAMLSGAEFVEFSVFYESFFDRVPLAHIDHAWLLEHLPHRNVAYAIAKRAIDTAGALVGLVIAAPFILIAALFIRFSAGEIFIRHERVGKGGSHFRIIKLRTMLLDDHGDPELQKKNRVTRLGKFLRKTRIDELPQLVNVLAGDLSFIGPRPELPAIAATYEQEIPYYDVRHLLTPGLSGWAQIYNYDAPRGAADVERTRIKLSYDIYYLKHRSFGLDMAIALKTLRALFAFSGT